MPETLIQALEELEAEYAKAMADPAFKARRSLLPLLPVPPLALLCSCREHRRGNML